MFWAFFTLLMIVGVLAVLAWLGWRRIAAHVRANPEAARALIDHILTPLLLGELPANRQKPAPKPEANPEGKRVKATLV